MRIEDLKQAIGGHMPELDALRGIAILWVILHNAALDRVGHAQSLLMALVGLVAHMGWVGVQLFFVLSGFLITGILLEGRGAAHRFRNFYARRTLRIFPVYYGFLLLAFVILPWMGLVTWVDSTRLERILYWSYLTNWGLPFGNHATFPHLWSLAIEEQYYLLWPLLVVSLGNRALVRVCLALIITAVLSRAWLVSSFDPDFSSRAMYTFSFARWDALAIGSLLAIAVRSDHAVRHIQRWFTPAFVTLTLVLLAQVALLRNFSPAQVQGVFNQTTIALWSAMLMLLAIVPWRNRLDRLRPVFASRFLRWVGKYSYAIYIFFMPAKMLWFGRFALAVTPDAPWRQLGVALYNLVGITAIAVVAAWLSWHLLEQPFLKLKRHFV